MPSHSLAATASQNKKVLWRKLLRVGAKVKLVYLRNAFKSKMWKDTPPPGAKRAGGNGSWCGFWVDVGVAWLQDTQLFTLYHFFKNDFFGNMMTWSRHATGEGVYWHCFIQIVPDVSVQEIRWSMIYTPFCSRTLRRSAAPPVLFLLFWHFIYAFL